MSIILLRWRPSVLGRFAVALLALHGVQGEAADMRLPSDELGVRVWLSTGRTTWNHTAPGFGNPTSVLTYDGLTAGSFELHFRRGFGQLWFVGGELGIGRIRGGTLEDEDFFAGQVKYLHTRSAVRGEGLHYVNIDVGRVLGAVAGGRMQIAALAGFVHWSERYDAYGLTYLVNFFDDADLPPELRVITNEVRWNGARIGVQARYRTGRYTFAARLAAVPYAELHNRDFHYLRWDLGPVPNIHMNGSGRGWQMDAELRRQIAGKVELGLGLRHWSLEADGTIHFRPVSGALPLNELRTRRSGVTASLLWRF